MTSGLRRFLQPAPRPRPGERCEMCTEPVSEEHSHVIDLESRSIMCTCRGCYLLFTHTGAGGKRHRAVPDRFLHAPAFSLGSALWESIGIPVRMAFLFRNSVIDTTVAFYPSPAGATESLLPLGAWEEILESDSELATVSPDVEALLINKNDDGFECFLVPIDVCYELVGLVRLHWRGFDGGTEVWDAINGFFDGLRLRSKLVGSPDG
jgi:hypothetical protein